MCDTSRVHWRLNLPLTLLASLLLTSVGQAASPNTTPATSTNTGDPVIYALGALLERDIDSFDLSEAELKTMLAGLTDSYHHRATTANAQNYGPQLETLQRTRMAAAAQRAKQAGAAYLEKVAAFPGATRTANGLVYVPLTAGAGASPTAADEVRVRYVGRRIDGTVFDRSAAAEGVSFSLGGVIPCWTQALPLMKVGGKARVVCPPELAYGDRGAPPVIRPASTLDFQIELLGITPVPAVTPAQMAPNPPPAPPDTASHD
jgi:FKBP-type peptidyl-prolyl cis-trans isomerase FkpA/FKBP-type peptidyl-prolyl cis-trans isomerase FklB